MKINSLKFLAIICFGIFLNSNVFGQENDTNTQNDFVKDSLSIAVSADAMNVLYIGLGNPLTIAVSGYAADKIIAKISDGYIYKNGNNYIVNVGKRGEANIEIYAIGNDSNLTLLGVKKFRVREIPKPETQMGTLQNGNWESIATILANATKVYASLGSFAYDRVKYDIKEFRFTIAKKVGESKPTVMVNGNRLNEVCLELLKDLVSGDKIIIDGIKAEGPGGKIDLAPIVITAR